MSRMKLLAKNILFTLLVPGTVAGYVPMSLTSGLPLQAGGGLIAGVALGLTGVAIYLWCAWDFATAGHATPAPIDPPTELVVRGLYRYSRNPMYVGVLSVIFGWALLFGARSVAIYGVCAGTVFHLVVVLYEEPYLTKRFGEAYQRYRARVRRWI